MGSPYRNPRVEHYLSPVRYVKSEHTVSAQAPDAQVLELGVVEDAVLGAFAAGTGFLDAPERRHFIGNQARVESHDAVLQRFRNAPRAGQVARIEIRGQAELGVIGHADGLG